MYKWVQRRIFASRRWGQVLEVAGTTAQDGDTPTASDEYAQTKRILEKIAAALHEAGATLAQVVRTRIFVTNIAQWEAVGRANGAVFGQIRPASTMVQVAALIDPRLLVEMEASAIIAEQPAQLREKSLMAQEINAINERKKAEVLDT